MMPRLLRRRRIEVQTHYLFVRLLPKVLWVMLALLDLGRGGVPALGNLVENLQPSVTEIFVHLAHDFKNLL